MYTVKEVAIMLGVNQETVRRWVRTGILQASKESRKDGFSISEVELSQFIHKNPKYKDDGLFVFADPGTYITNCINDIDDRIIMLKNTIKKLNIELETLCSTKEILVKSRQSLEEGEL